MNAELQAADAAAVSSEVRQLLDDQLAAWNRGDLDGFMAAYWRSPNLTLFAGRENLRGWQARLDRYRTLYQADGHKMGQLSLSALEVEPLGPEAAFVRGRWDLALARQSQGGLFTLVFRKLAEGWRIVHDHTSS